MTATAQPPAQRGPRKEFLIVRADPAEKLAAIRLARRLGHKGDVSALLRDLLQQAAKADTRTPAAGR